MLPSSPKPETPEGRYSVFSFEETEGRYYRCFDCNQELKEGDPIWVEPFVSYDYDGWIIMWSIFHTACYDREIAK